MKRCPECKRDYTDETLNFCLDDGTVLLDGPTSVPGLDSEPQTAILREPAQTDDSSIQLQTNSSHSTAVFPPSSADIPIKKGLDRRLYIALLALAAIVYGAFLGYRYFVQSNSGTINSIAVLPFENRSGNPDAEYLSDGLSDSLIYRLTQLPNLKVSPTSSVVRYKGRQADVADIAKELDVDAVMSGKLAQRGEDLTISVELVDARTKKLIWAEQYDRKMADLLATQREIATKITEKLQLNLAGNETGITKKYTDSNEAYQLYMRGRYSFAKRTKDEMLRSIEYFRQAVKLDPNFALAYARLSEVYGSMPAYPYLSPKEAFPQAKAAAQKALEIDPSLSEAHTSLAYSLIIYDWDWVEGERSFKRALELDPNNANAHFRYGQVYLLPLGRFDEAISEIDQGVNAEPLDVNMGVTRAWAELVSGRHEKALELMRKIYEFEPNHPLSRWLLSQILNEMGRYEESLAITEKWLQDEPNNQFALRDAGVAYARSGQRDKAEEMIRRYRELSKIEWVPASRIAAIYGALGEMDEAFAEMEKALEARDWDTYRMNIEVYMRPLRDEARFAELVKRMKLPQ